MMVLLTLLGVRERTRTGVRTTHATLLVVREAIDAYRADHDRKCPPSLEALRQAKYLYVEPVDAWGRPLQLTCPGRRDPDAYDLVSFGPSGDLNGLDRIE
jgi:general secretion pathway protein G